MLSQFYKKMRKVFAIVLSGSVFTLSLYGGNTPTTTGINAALSAITTLLLLGDTGTRFAFRAYDGVHEYELWKSDGTAAGTVMVKDIAAGPSGSLPSYLTNVNGVLYFSADDGVHGYELWKSDGTAAGTVMVKDIYAGPNGSYPNYLTNVNGTLFFSADSGLAIGTELWKSDGTEAGTVMVKNISVLGNSDPQELTNVNGTLFFSADDGAPGTGGRELWESDGTEAGTVMYNINPNSNSNPQELTNVNGTLYFSANDGSNGSELWSCIEKTILGQPTTLATLVKDINPSGDSDPQELTNVNGTLYFSADDGAHGLELWSRSEVTLSNGLSLIVTSLVKDINTGLYGSSPGNLTNVNGVLYFRADDRVHGDELWKSDGTAAGTVMVKNINAGPSGSWPGNLTNVNGVLYFSADDGVHGNELWKSDGTAAGTVMVKDINPNGDTHLDELTNVNGTLYFTADDGQHGWELWRSDGTATGTVMVKDIRAGSDGSDPSYITKF